jgi:uncharacterized protein (TIGR00661 family)
MKILYGIQGTGNGHLTRSVEIIEVLKKYAQVDVLISGEQFDLPLPFKPDYRLKGLYFVFGKNGGIDLIETYKRIKTFRLLKEIRNFPVEKYDLVISDFEPVSCWAAKLKNVKCIGLSNQAATLHPSAPRPKSFDPLGKMILEYYAPVSADYGFHFKSLSETIFTPIIRKEVRKLQAIEKEHYTVYLPSYDDERIIKHLKKFDKFHWQVFSKHCSKPHKLKNIEIRPVQGKKFLESLASSKGIICNAGFGTTSEALFLGKKLLVIPMKTQYEQQCNAAMLKSMGVPVIKSLRKKHHEKISDWLVNGKAIQIDYPNRTEEIIEKILSEQVNIQLPFSGEIAQPKKLTFSNA